MPVYPGALRFADHPRRNLDSRVVLTATLPVIILRHSRAKTFDTRPLSTRESAEVNSSINHWRRQTMNVVLVHGGFVDGAGWEGVYKILKRDGNNVSIVQNPTISLEDDVAVTKRILAAQDGPTILVGHSYGGAVITEAGNHPKVSA